MVINIPKYTYTTTVFLYIYRIEPIRCQDVEIQVLYRRLAPQILVQGISALQG